jgi:hypothetical protein
MVEYITKKEICGKFHAKCGTRDLTTFSGLSRERRDGWSPYSQPTGESRTDPGEACFGRLPALREHDFQPHQQAAIQAQNQVPGPAPEEDPQFPSACEGSLGTQRLLVCTACPASVVKST